MICYLYNHATFDIFYPLLHVVPFASYIFTIKREGTSFFFESILMHLQTILIYGNKTIKI